MCAGFPHGTVWGGCTPFSLHQGLKRQQGAWQKGGMPHGSSASAPWHSTPLLQQSLTDTNPALGLGKHTARARLPKALLSLKKQFSVPSAGLREARPWSRDSSIVSPTLLRAFPAHPNGSSPAQVSRTKKMASRGCQRVPATPPGLAGPGCFCPAGTRATRGVLSGVDGPSGARGRLQGVRGPRPGRGRPGSSAGRRRGRRRTRGAYCW